MQVIRNYGAIPVACPRCLRPFTSAFSGIEGATIIGCSESCPSCGAVVPVPDGTIENGQFHQFFESFQRWVPKAGDIPKLRLELESVRAKAALTDTDIASIKEISPLVGTAIEAVRSKNVRMIIIVSMLFLLTKCSDGITININFNSINTSAPYSDYPEQDNRRGGTHTASAGASYERRPNRSLRARLLLSSGHCHTSLSPHNRK